MISNLKFRKAVSFFILAAILIFVFPLFSSTVPIEGNILVKLAPEEAPDWLGRFGQAEWLFGSFYRLRTKDPQNVLDEIRGQRRVEYAVLDSQVKVSVISSDPLFVTDSTSFTKQWYLPKMQIPDAWDQTTGGSVTVAVVDTGIDANHEDLNDGRVGKGFASYCPVVSSVSSDQCATRITSEIAAGVNSDDNGHGTVVAGLIGAIPNNGKGISGINWNVRLMPIKVLNSEGTGFTSDLALGIKWAVDNGAKILNLSIGGEGLSGEEVLQEAITYAFNKGVLIIAAAGNDSAENGVNLNISPSLPVCADGGQNMIIGVSAVDAADKKVLFSNYGSNCVDIAAPGAATYLSKQQKQGIVSTYFDPARPALNNLYAYAVGTSIAAPMVSGIAALVLSINPELDVRALRDRLLSSVDNIDAINETGCGTGTCVGQIGKGRINAKKAMTVQNIFVSGTLVRDENNAVYLIENGLKRLVSDFVLKQRFATTPITSVKSSQLNAITRGPAVTPVDGTLIKDPDIATVYLIEGGKLHALSYLAFLSRNFSFSKIMTLPRAEIVTYEVAEDASISNGLLIKAVDHPAVYAVNNGVRQLISYFVFLQRFKNAQIAAVSREELDRFPLDSTGFLSPPFDGTVFKGDGSQTVYLEVGGKKHGLNLNAFFNRGYQFNAIQVLPQSEADGYEAGPDIIE